VVLVPPVIAVDPCRPPELCAQHHQHLVEQPLGLEIRRRGDHRLVKDRGLAYGALEVVTGDFPLCLLILDPSPGQLAP
jgi:hypothetical protein